MFLINEIQYIKKKGGKGKPKNIFCNDRDLTSKRLKILSASKFSETNRKHPLSKHMTK